MKVIVTPGFVIYFAWESIYFAYLDFKCSKKVPKFLKLCLSKKTQCCSQYTYIYVIYICRPYHPNSNRCLLCLNEKYEIATYKGDNLLNKRTEIINTCRHRSKYKLANCDTIAIASF